ncbi:TPA: hypothetical protein DEO28_04270 [Candidatus Dependentiae bacterium]|nr:MAG: hypothetical protein UR14_C0006G0091 [candidate division TM6 bacterium GW2011_GWE2_31_21]KKP53486.1 MAG: hypothetical protein UR43_C0004G0027 [candidate division TM6 bacterium GW2011_GWF2_33_332]HBS48272.1 hypothetical protein [Candidatus Dependentiae bacterium]HBZ73699.1 hypothetical protein [Candidatus Dependentiae bacterium]
MNKMLKVMSFLLLGIALLGDAKSKNLPILLGAKPTEFKFQTRSKIKVVRAANGIMAAVLKDSSGLVCRYDENGHFALPIELVVYERIDNIFTTNGIIIIALAGLFNSFYSPGKYRILRFKEDSTLSELTNLPGIDDKDDIRILQVRDGIILGKKRNTNVFLLWLVNENGEISEPKILNMSEQVVDVEIDNRIIVMRLYSVVKGHEENYFRCFVIDKNGDISASQDLITLSDCSSVKIIGKKIIIKCDSIIGYGYQAYEFRGGMLEQIPITQSLAEEYFACDRFVSDTIYNKYFVGGAIYVESKVIEENLSHKIYENKIFFIKNLLEDPSLTSDQILFIKESMEKPIKLKFDMQLRKFFDSLPLAIKDELLRLGCVYEAAIISRKIQFNPQQVMSDLNRPRRLFS